MMAQKRRSVKKIVLISLLILGIISLFLIWNQSEKKVAVAINLPSLNIGPINFRPVAQWPSYGAPYLPYGSAGPQQSIIAPGWINLGDGTYVNPSYPPGPAGGRYVKKEGVLPPAIEITKYADPEGHTPMGGFTVKSVSFKIKTTEEFEFYVARTTGVTHFHFDFLEGNFRKLDEALLDGNWHTVEKDLGLPSGYQKEDYEFKVFSFLFHFNEEDGFRIDDIVITSDEGVQFVLDDFEYDDAIGNHEWELPMIYDEEYFEPLIPVYDDEIGSLVFECDDSYRKKGPGDWVYKVNDRTYSLVRPDILPSAYRSSQSSGYGSFNYGFQNTPNYSTYNFGYNPSLYNFGYNPPTYTVNRPFYSYGFAGPSFTSDASGFYPPYNQGYGMTFGAPPFYGNFGFPGNYPVFGGGYRWY